MNGLWIRVDKSRLRNLGMIVCNKGWRGKMVYLDYNNELVI